MTDQAPDKCTGVTVLFEGEQHGEAAHAFMIQFADGGMDQDIERRLENQGFVVRDTGFDLVNKTLTIKL